MVTGSRVEGGAQVLSAGVRRTIQSIKEIVGNHSDADIYVALKETDMDPNETAQKLLNQDPFHEVKRKKDRKKEPQIVAHKSFVAAEPKRNTELECIPEKNSSYPDPDARRGGYGLNTTSDVIPVKNSTYPDPTRRGRTASGNYQGNPNSNARSGGYGPNTASGNHQGNLNSNARSGGYGPNTASGNHQGNLNSNARKGGYGPNTASGNHQGNLNSNARKGGYGPNIASGNYQGNLKPNAQRGGYCPNPESGNVPVKNNTYPVRNARRGGYVRNTSSGISQEFRIVRDNRTGQNAKKSDSKPDQCSNSTSEAVISSGSIKRNSTESSGHQEPTSAQYSPRAFNNPADSQPKKTKVTASVGNDRKETPGEKPLLVSSTTSRVQSKANGPIPSSSSSSSVVGVYSSNSDPVHVPSLHPRPSANVGAIRREVGVVGPRRHSSVSAANPSSSQITPLPNTQSRLDGEPTESPRSFNGMSKSGHSSQNIGPESSTHGLHLNKSSSSNQYVSRPHQPTGHQKAPQPSKEWKPKDKPKACVKPSASGPGVIGSPGKTRSPPSDKQDVLKKNVDQMQDSLSQLNISENQNVIIAEHIRVSETDRCRLTFGSFATELDASANSMSMTAEGAGELYTDPSGSVSISAPESSGDEQAGGSKQLEMMNDSVRSSGSNTPASGDVTDHQLTEEKDSSVHANLDNYVDVSLVRDHNSSYTPESLQQRDTSVLPSFSSYDPQMGYGMSYFPPSVDESVRGQGLPSSQEVLNTNTTNTIPASTIAMVQQQQQQQLAQMYPQLHVSHFTNVMPYRQFLSPMYVPPMQVPGYSNSPTYPHPPNGNSYVLMPGNNSHHLPANSIKYGIQQFKPVPTGGQAVFGNFTSPAGYTINTPGIVTSSGGHDDASRLKYKDNLYAPNPQAETSEIWMNQRDLPGLQSGSYYNMPGQTPHPAYLTPHSGHTPFTAAQSSHMQQFSGMYHPSPQPAAIAGPHHMGPAIGGGVAAAAPGPQVGAYQQPQLGHLNWAGNF